MSDEGDDRIPRVSNARGILVLVAALPLLALTFHVLAGPLVAASVSGVYALALGLTALAERHGEPPSRDPATGLPDRDAALARLETIFDQKLAGSSQAGVFVIKMLDPADGAIPPTDRQPITVMAAARLAGGLRRGDQIIKLGDHSLAAILGPSRGLMTSAAESILARIDEMFREPMRIGSRTIPTSVSLGACLQHDAPRADARSWLEAAELAAVVAAEQGRPRLFPSGATKVDRSAWDECGPAADATEAEDEVRWRAVAAGRAEDTTPDQQLRRRGRA